MPFQPGQSGNPGGRPKEVAALKSAAREHTDKAIGVLARALDDDDARVRIAAAQALLDRGYGKPPQTHGGDEDLPPIQHEAKVTIVRIAGDQARST